MGRSRLITIYSRAYGFQGPRRGVGFGSSSPLIAACKVIRDSRRSTCVSASLWCSKELVASASSLRPWQNGWEPARSSLSKSVSDRLALARAFGADETVNLNDIAEARDRLKIVRQMTDGWGADVVCEFVGHASVMSEGIQMLAPGGRYLEVGCINRGTSIRT